MIELQGITRRFRVGDQQVLALNQVDLQIDRGEYISVMGPSGSGKSTLLHLLGLLDHASEGHYLFENQDVTGLSDEALATLRQQRIGFVFQFFHLVPRLTARQNIELPLTLAGMAPAQRQQRVNAALAAMQLEARASHRPDQLSGGQRQRVAIARATILQPSIILADEPTGNLDQQSGREIIAVLEQLQHSGITLIIVTHDPDLGRRALRRIRMVDGRITEDLRNPP